MGFDWHWMASRAERDEDQVTWVLPDLRPAGVFYVVLCPLSSPLSSCNRKKHFSLLCPCLFPSSQMCEVTTSNLKPVMSISLMVLNISGTWTFKFFCFKWILQCDYPSCLLTGIQWQSVQQPGCFFSGLFPPWLPEESDVLWPPCLDNQPSSLGLP